jgi:hypothetical protein
MGDRATCLRLLERAAVAANVARDGAALTAALSTTTTTATNVVGIPTPDESEEASVALVGGRRQPPATQDGRGGLCRRIVERFWSRSTIF